MSGNSNDTGLHETWRPLPCSAPDRIENRIIFKLRLFLDLQVSTVYRDIKRILPDAGNTILEIGCGSQPYRHLIPKKAKYYAIDWKYAGRFSYYKNNDAIYYDGTTFPLRDGIFDFVFHTEVLEHIYDLNYFLSECYRVISQKGRMFFTIPFAARYHYIPYDYWRLTPAGIERILQNAGLRNIVIAPRGTDITTAISKLNTICYRQILKHYDNVILKLLNMVLFGALFIIPVLFLTILGHISISLKIGSPDDPLGYSVYCEK